MDKAKNKARKHGWYVAKKARIRRKQRAYYKAHPEEMRAYRTAYYQKNKDKLREWRKNNPEIVQACARTPQARFKTARTGAENRNLPFNLSFAQYLKLVEGKTCTYCRGALPEAGCGLDRKNSNFGYSVKNCVPCCHACNQIRGKDLISYTEMLEVADLLRKLRRQK